MKTGPEQGYGCPGQSPGYGHRLPFVPDGVVPHRGIGARSLSALATLLLVAVMWTIPSSVFGQAPPEHSLAALGGRLIGRSNGEWGGSLHFEYGNGLAQRLLEQNVVGLHKVGSSVVVFTGLAHLTRNDGAIYLVRRKSRHELSVALLHRLAGEPSEITQHKSGAVHFGVFTGELAVEARPEGQSYVVTRKVLACQELNVKLALRSVPCGDRIHQSVEASEQRTR